MKPRPVVKYKDPSYPTRLEILKDPALLEKNLPSGWRKSAELLSAAAIFLSANTIVNAGTDKTAENPKAAVVAPIFEHGEGRGVTGCVALNPPVFLSEEEALQVIIEELSKSEIEISKKDIIFDNIQIPPRYNKLLEKEKKLEIVVDSKNKVPLEVDILDEKRKVAIEYVSKDDYFTIGGISGVFSVDDYNFKEVSEYIRKEIEKQGKDIYFGVLYDPISMYYDKEMLETWGLSINNLREESKTQLRLQVKDFVEWLIGQGVI